MIYVKALLISLLVTTAVYSGNDLPPVPGIGYKEMQRKALRQCKVPPQIAILPPQIAQDYRDCVNSYYSPDPATAESNLKNLGLMKKEDKLISIKEAEGFIRAYEFLYETEEKGGFFSSISKKTTKIILCDDSMRNCYRVSNSVRTK
jgi:hypothetical protein